MKNQIWQNANDKTHQINGEQLIDALCLSGYSWTKDKATDYVKNTKVGDGYCFINHGKVTDFDRIK